MGKIKIEDWDHAVLVRGTLSIDEARAALQEAKRDDDTRLGCRPLYFQGDACVAFYRHSGGAYA